MDLAKKTCVPCKGGIPKLTPGIVQNYLKEVSGWELKEEKIFKSFHCKDFKQAIRFVNEMADLAEAEGHHPNFCVNFRDIDVTIWTHAVDGLTESDFILAAKIDEIAKKY